MLKLIRGISISIATNSKIKRLLSESLWWWCRLRAVGFLKA